MRPATSTTSCSMLHSLFLVHRLKLFLDLLTVLDETRHRFLHPFMKLHFLLFIFLALVVSSAGSLLSGLTNRSAILGLGERGVSEFVMGRIKFTSLASLVPDKR